MSLNSPSCSGAKIADPARISSKGRGPDEPGPTRLVHRDAELGGQPSHVAVEVGQEVVIVHEDHVRLVPAGPGVGQVMHGARERVEVFGGVRLPVDPAAQPLVQRRLRRFRLGRPRGADELGLAHPVDVGAVEVKGDGRVERVAAHDDIGRPVVEGHPVERGVGLDDPPMRLRGQAGVDHLDREHQVVHPRRQDAQLVREFGRLEHQQQADHLRPGRPRARAGADDDVALAEGKTSPAGAVVVG